MHTLLDLSGTFAVIFLSGIGLLAFLRQQSDWRQRRRLQVLILTLPLASVIVMLGGLHHVIESTCSHPDPVWDHTLDITFLALVGTVFIGAALLGIMRLVLMKRAMMQKELVLDASLQARVNMLTAQHGIAPVRVRLSYADHPLALIYGLQQPTILLSTWMKEHLDEQELEAVLAHELGHLSQHDYLLNWLITMLRDAFFFLPSSRIAYRQFRQEKELACDDLVVRLTRRPLALASALTKVWLSQVDGGIDGGVDGWMYGIEQQLVGGNKSIAERVERLLGQTETTQAGEQKRAVLRLGGAPSILLLSTLAFTLMFALLLMNC